MSNIEAQPGMECPPIQRFRVQLLTGDIVYMEECQECYAMVMYQGMEHHCPEVCRSMWGDASELQALLRQIYECTKVSVAPRAHN